MGSNSVTMENRVVLFVDIHNFSLASSEMADDQFSFLQEVYERLGSVIVNHQGEIIKYMGDALLCLFAKGSEKEAVNCSVELRRVYRDIVRKRKLATETELEVGIGSGEVAIGIFGHESLKQRDVFGEVVNQAAVIGHHRGVAVTEPVYSTIKSDFQTRELPGRDLKWRADPLKVWEIVE